MTFSVETAGGARAETRRDLLDLLVNALGKAELRGLWPFLETDPGVGAQVQDVSSRAFHGANVAAFGTDPFLFGGVLAYVFDGTDEFIVVPDNVLLSFDGTTDKPFSVGACIYQRANAAIKTIVAKWDVAGDDREWRLYMDAAEKLTMELCDDGVPNAEQGRLYNTALGTDQWYFVAGTYDGSGGATAGAGINLYAGDFSAETWLGAVDDADANGVGVYVDMENTAETVNIGSDTSAGGAEFFLGSMALVWVTARELTEAELVNVWNICQEIARA